MEEFIDTPVKFYSSGMVVRLGFSVAISAEPDVLIVDEVLSVGDVAFQRRGFNRMLELQENGTTVLVVSHNVSAIQRIAPRTVVLHDGSVKFIGPTADAIEMYYELLKVSVLDETGSDESLPVHLEPVEMFGADGQPTAVIQSHDEVTLRMAVRFREPVDQPIFWFGIRDDAGTLVFAERSTSLGDHELAPGDLFTLSMRVPMSLVAGTYAAIGGISWSLGPNNKMISHRKSFSVSGRTLVRGLVDLAPTVEIQPGVTLSP
jgi:lipopolysaccharide transport system ATP-binding protein